MSGSERYEEVRIAVVRALYEAAMIFERLEDQGLIRGNGHDMAQKVGRYGIRMLAERWHDPDAVRHGDLVDASGLEG